MKTLRRRYERFQSWAIPLGYAAGALALGMALPRIETRLFPDLVVSVSAQGVIALSSSIASGMIALTGIVFSLTFVMVQFSASAYSPRLVLWVARDPVMSHALGMFTATFLYALTVLAWADRAKAGHAPFFSAWAVIALLVASMGMFVALIERVGFLQVNRMLIFTGDRGRKAIEDLYPALVDGTALRDSEDPRKLQLRSTLAHAGRPQVIQAFDAKTLVELAEEAGVVLEMAGAVGDTLLEGMPLLRVYGGGHLPDEHQLRRAIEIGHERTFEQDPKYAIRLVVDIAIKALSSAINDPTTAVQALDQIEDLLLRLGRCHLELEAFRDRAGNVRLVIPFPTWDDFLRLGLDEIQAYGANSVQVMRRMKALIANLKTVLPSHRHEALDHWAKRLQGSIARSFADAEEKREASVPDRQGLGIGHEQESAFQANPKEQRT